MFKMALLDCAINEKCCSVDGERGKKTVDSSKVPTPGNLPFKAKKKMLTHGGQPGGGGTGRSWN